MDLSVQKTTKNKKLFLAVLISFFILPSCGRREWFGVWEGNMGSGSHLYRMALTLGKGWKVPFVGDYTNVDDGIYGEGLRNVSVGWNFFHGETQDGGRFDLQWDWGRNFLAGTFTQGRGSSSQQSLIRPGETYPVTLFPGNDFVLARKKIGDEPEYRYEYRPPPALEDGWKPGDLRRMRTDVSKIEAEVRKILSLDYPYVHSLLVVRGGKLVLDEYFWGYGPGKPHPVQSVTKSIFSLLFGIAESQGAVRLDEKLFDDFPAYRRPADSDSRRAAITLRQLLTMTSGLGCDDSKDSKDCSWAMVDSQDWLNFTLSLPLGEKPGSYFVYCGACLTPLGILLEKRSGLKLPEYAQKLLFDPLGIKSFLWWEGPQGIHSPAFGLALTPRDMAKIGYLVLKKGEWEGRQLVPQKWIEESTAVQVSRKKTGKDSDYGYLWWEREAFWHGKKVRVLDAWGVGGQHIFIVPRLDLVCVLTGGNYKDSGLANNAFKIFENVIDAFH